MRLRPIQQFLKDESGATAIEYALLGTLIGVALLGTFTMLGDNVGNMFGSGTNSAGNVIATQTAKIPR